MTTVSTYCMSLAANRPDAFAPKGTPANHMFACLSELARKVSHFYYKGTDSYAKDRDVVAVEISRVALNDGYTAAGHYYGGGIPLFSLDLDLRAPDGEIHWLTVEVRATDRKRLRAELATMFRNAKISR